MRAAHNRISTGLLLSLLTSVPGVGAQQGDERNAQVQVGDTLQVYVSLMQVPVLVLNSFRTAVESIPSTEFRIKLQNFPEFAPQRARFEGDDPISFAILLDTSDPAESLWRELPHAAPVLGASLRSWDTVDLYTINGCQMRQAGRLQAPSGATLGQQFAAALSIPPYRRSLAGPCAHPISLWDAMLYAADQLRSTSGRKVMLVLSNGSKAADPDVMDRLRLFLTDRSITVFNLWHGSGQEGPYLLRLDDGKILSGTSFLSRSSFFNTTATVNWSEYALGTEAELSGGVTKSVAPGGVPEALSEVVSRVRGRYILEFPRPSGLQPGRQGISVTVRRKNYFIRTAGITVPTRDPDRKLTSP